MILSSFLCITLLFLLFLCCPPCWCYLCWCFCRTQGDLFVRKIVMNRVLECVLYDANLAARQIQGAWRSFYFWKTASHTLAGRLLVREEVCRVGVAEG